MKLGLAFYFCIFGISGVGAAVSCTPSLTGSVLENEAIDTSVTLDFSCTGVDANTTYSLTGTTSFSIPVLDTLNIVTVVVLDTEAASSHSFTLDVDTGIVDSFAIVITVTDVNEFAPTCSPSAVFVTVDENTGSGASVASLSCTDADTTDSVSTYVISGDDITPKFDLPSASVGDIVTSSNNLDYETKQSYALYVDVVDTLSTQLTGTATVYVQVGALNDNVPVWTTFIPAYVSATTPYNIAEDSTVGISIVTIAATDNDLGADGDILYSILAVTDSAGNSALAKFRVDSVSGEIEVIGSFDYESSITYYDVEVQASDGGTPATSVTRDLRVGITDVNDNSPAFSQVIYDASTTEGSAIGTSILQLVATDADSGSVLSYSITAGNGATKFRLNATNDDILELAGVIDVDSGVADVAAYTLTVQVSDGTNIDTANVYVTVVSNNDHDPVFGSPGMNNIPEDSSVGYSVGSITATDDDYGTDGQITYSITGGDTGGQFSIDTGEIYLKAPVDYDTMSVNPAVLTITATDGGGRTDVASISATVTDVNDNAPTCSQYSYTIAVSETTATSTELVALNCSDVDSGETLTYGIFSGNTGNDFALDSSGSMTIANALDYDAGTQTYDLVLTIKDNGNTHTSTVAVSMSVGAVNEGAPNFSPAVTSLTYTESISVTSHIVTKTASDIDASPHDVILYEIDSVTGGTTDTFLIDQSSGKISLAKALDHNNSPYEIVIVATDGGGLQGNATISITVTDVNDNSPVCNPTVWNLVIPENDALGTLISDLQCTDADSGVYGTITYSITQSPGSGDFTINTTTGQVSLAATQDYESGQIFYSLEVTAADDGGSGNSVVVPISVTISAVNEGPPVFSGSFTASIDEDIAVGTSVVDVTATDIDGDSHPHGKRYYSIVAGNSDNNFLISPTSGRLLTAGGFDRETTSYYSLSVEAIEEAGTNSATATVNITINDVDDNTPTCTQSVFAVDVEEDTSVPLTLVNLTCSDGDTSSTLSYSLGSGDASKFSVTGGYVNLNSAVDYDLGTREYSLTITVSDDAISAHTFDVYGTVNVLPINEHTPTFSAGTYTQSIREDESLGFVVMTLSASDQDSTDSADGQVTYSVVSGSTPTFTLEATAGDIVLTRDLDRESVDQYVMEVTASDGSLSSTATVTIDVTDVNDNAPLFNPRSYSATIPETASVGTSVLTVYATDVDDNSTTNNAAIVYSITAGNTDGFLAIDTYTGEITVISALDFETSSSYTLEITVKDKSGGTGALSDTTTAVVRISGSNEATPVFSSPSYSTSISETSPIGTSVLSVSATDSDDGEDGSVYYGMSPHAYFTLDSETGIIYIKSTLNYEVDTNHTLLVTAYDRGTLQNSVDATVAIDVTDENDNSPNCVPRSFSKTIREDEAVGYVVASLSCTDDDSGLSGTLDYAVDSVNGNPASLYFAVNSSGIVVTSGSLDYESNTFYEVIIDVFDTSVSPLTTTVLVIVSVTDVNEHTPTFTGQPSTASVTEDVAIGTSIVTITATDQDIEDIISYSLNPASSYFTIDPSTGVIKTKSHLDYENSTSVVLSIEAVDSGSVDSTRSSAHSMTVTITDVNDAYPVFSPASYLASIGENDAVSTTALVVTATDDDSGTFGTVTYSIVSGNDDAVFRIDLYVPTRTGEVIIDSTANLDYETSNLYTLTIAAFDGGGKNDTCIASITVTPYNEYSPVFTPSSTYTTSWLENTPVGSVIETVLATDIDAGSDGIVEYKVISGGSKFAIDSSNGNITLVSLLDREVAQTHSIVLTATDGGQVPGALTSTATVSLTVLDYNDNTPTFNPAIYTSTLAEDASNGDLLTTVICEDGDLDPSNINDQFQFSLATSDGSSNFVVGSSNGEVRVALGAGLDFESNTSYTLTVLAIDQGTPALTGSVVVTVEITGVNEHSPVFDNGTYTISIAENEVIGSSLIQLNATDDDNGIDGMFYFTISGGNLAGKFTIDPLGGDIHLIRAMDRETTASYDLTVQAIDYGVSPLTGTATVSILVTDYNDNEPYCASTMYTSTILEHSAIGTYVETIVCYDDDEGINSVLQYSIFSGNTGSAFQIDANTGNVTVLTDSAIDAQTANVMELTILVEDQGLVQLSTTVTLIVTLTDVNQYAPMFIAPGTYSTSVSEAAPIGTFILQVNATDDDIGENGEVTYSIVCGDPGNFFSVHSTTGEITLQDTLDISVQSSHVICIEATDQATVPLTSTANVTVTVTDSNNNEPQCSPSFYAATISEASPLNTFVTTINCTDSDTLPLNNQINYFLKAGDPMSQFSIDVNSGEVTVTGALDYENMTIYHLMVEAEDTGSVSLTSTVQITVSITNENEFTPQIVEPGGGYSTDIYENITIGTTIITISSTDDDDGIQGVVRYSITGGNTPNHFTIHEDTGDIQVAASLDRESTDSYTLTVRATDSVPGSSDELHDEAIVAISILDVNDNYPTFVPTVYVTSVLEGAASGSAVASVTVTDDDIGVNAQYNLNIVSGNNGNAFSLSGDQVTVFSALDHEVISQFDLRITAEDQGSPTLTSTCRVVINVLSENEYPPVFDYANNTVTVFEDIAVGTLIYDANATDADQNTPGILTYQIGSGNPGGVVFLIDQDNGKIITGSYLDYDAVPNIYYLNITTHDNAGANPYLVDWMLLTVILEDVNDNTPVFTQNIYSQFISEDILDDTSVIVVTANDIDATHNGEVAYTIDGGDGHSQFVINASMGEIRTVSPHSLDRESKDTYTLLVKAEDQGTPVRSSFCIVNIYLTDINDNIPDFTPNDFVTSLDENLAPSTYVTAVYAVDPDIGNNALLTFSIDPSSDPNGHFSITVPGNDTAEIYTTTIFDRENIEQYVLTILAADFGSTRLTGTATVTILVLDLNDNTPVISGQPYDNSIYENVNVGTTVFDVDATDADKDINSLLTYVITSGDLGSFIVDADTGILTTRQALDRETTAYYSIVVEVTDNGSPARTATTTTTVTILDINDNTPVFLVTFNFTIAENVPNTTSVGTVYATDADTGVNAALQYSFIQTKVGHDYYFMVDAGSGTIFTTNDLLDREDTSWYEITIRATDGGSPVRYSDTDVIIDIADENDNYPYCTQNLFTAVLSETDIPGTLVTTVIAMDEDIGENADLNYTIANTSGVDYSHFSLDEDTGVVTLIQTIDRELTPFFIFDVLVTDKGASSLHTTCTVSVSVTDLNDNYPVFAQVFYSAEAPTDAASDWLILRVQAVDADKAANSLVMYAIESVQKRFEIEPFSGNITRTSETLAPNLKVVLEITARDAGIPSKITSVLVRIDTFDPELHVVIFNMTITEDEFWPKEQLFLDLLAATLVNVHPAAIVNVMRVERWVSEAGVSARRRLLTSTEFITVFLYAIDGNDTHSQANIGSPKVFVPMADLLATWRADDVLGTPSSSISGEAFQEFNIVSVHPYGPEELPWWKSKLGQILLICGAVLLALIIVIIIIYCCYCRKKDRRRGRKDIVVVAPIEEQFEPSYKIHQNRSQTASTTSQDSKHNVTQKRSAVIPAKEALEGDPWSVDPAPVPRQKPREALREEVIYDATAVDPDSGRLYEYSSQTFARRWVKDRGNANSAGSRTRRNSKSVLHS